MILILTISPSPNLYSAFYEVYEKPHATEIIQERLVDKLEQGEEVGRGPDDSLFTAYLQVFP